MIDTGNDVRNGRRRCCAADVTPVGVVVVCRCTDHPASSSTSPSFPMPSSFVSLSSHAFLLHFRLPSVPTPFTLFSLPDSSYLFTSLSSHVSTPHLSLSRTQYVSCRVPFNPPTSPPFIMGLPSRTDWPLAPLFLQHSFPSPL